MDDKYPACIVSRLPIEIRRLIFYFVPANIIRRADTEIIRHIIDVYAVDHHDGWTRRSHMYFVKHIVSFSEYVFAAYGDENENELDFGRTEFDTHELSDSVKHTIMELIIT